MKFTLPETFSIDLIEPLQIDMEFVFYSSVITVKLIGIVERLIVAGEKIEDSSGNIWIVTKSWIEPYTMWVGFRLQEKGIKASELPKYGQLVAELELVKTV